MEKRPKDIFNVVPKNFTQAQRAQSDDKKLRGLNLTSWELKAMSCRDLGMQNNFEGEEPARGWTTWWEIPCQKPT